MDKKLIQQERKKRCFIDAAVNIIKTEGVNNLTVKKVSELAGYAQGTLYNYFENVNVLLYYCVVDFFSELKGVLVNKQDRYKSSREKVVFLALDYCKYFIDNPNVYEVVFLKHLGIPPIELNQSDGYLPEIVAISRETLKKCADEGVIKATDVDMKLRLISNTLQANLLLFDRQRKLMTRQKLIEKVEEEINYVLDGLWKK